MKLSEKIDSLPPAIRDEVIDIVSIEPDIANFFAQIRSSGGVKTPDTLQLACALKCGVSQFITNDQRLSVFTRPELSIYSRQEYINHLP